MQTIATQSISDIVREEDDPPAASVPKGALKIEFYKSDNYNHCRSENNEKKKKLNPYELLLMIEPEDTVYIGGQLGELKIISIKGEMIQTFIHAFHIGEVYKAELNIKDKDYKLKVDCQYLGPRGFQI